MTSPNSKSGGKDCACVMEPCTGQFCDCGAGCLKDAAGVSPCGRTHPECKWCTFCGKCDHIEARCPTVAACVTEVSRNG